MFEALAGAAYRSKNYAKAIEWSDRYLKQGGSSALVRSLRTSAHYLSGDYAGVVKDMQTIPLCVANARRSPSYGCALRLDWARLGDPLGHAGFPLTL